MAGTRGRKGQKEIMVANDRFIVPKPIIGIRPWGNANISQVVQDSAGEIVGWNTESIVSAIRRHSNS